LKKSAFIIAAPSSGSGKTTVSIGLMAALEAKGYNVQPFKCGPDYIDPMYHSWATGKPSYSLDLYMSPEAHVKKLFYSKAACADISIAEGVMGLFDGAGKTEGSTAHLAAVLGLPVILVVNAKAMAYSAAALLHGFATFWPQLRLAGVIFNFVETLSHYQFLKQAAIDAGVEPLGYLPANEAARIKSRYLGLTTEAGPDTLSAIVEAAGHITKYIELDKLIALTQAAPVSFPRACMPVAPGRKTLRIAAAADKAFNFVYKANIDALSQIGEVEFFSPLDSVSLPSCDILYLAGGYPEKHTQALSANKAMLNSIASYCKKGGRVLAECGGMMYLGRSIIAGGVKWEMAGALNFSASMDKAKRHLGYRSMLWNGEEFCGHEFHYSQLTEIEEACSGAAIFNSKGLSSGTQFYSKAGIRASYVHFYWAHCCINFMQALWPDLKELLPKHDYPDMP
jgi:cobyrinic acid a,c-diamide synthase